MALGLFLLAAGGVLETSVRSSDLFLLAASGIIGIAVSDTFFHRGLNITGAGINAVVDTLYSPLTALAAFLMLGETLEPLQLLGMAMVIGGVLLSSRAEPPEGVSAARLLAGIGWGVAAMVTLAVGIVLAKPVLEEHSLLWASTIRQAAAFLAMAPAAMLSRRRREIWSVFRPGRTWRVLLPGTLLGSVIALLLWLAGMKYINAGSAAVLNQTSTIFILVLSAIFLGERLTLRRWAAALLAFAGIVLVTIG